MKRLLPAKRVSKEALRRLMKVNFLIFTFFALSLDWSFGQTAGQIECSCLGTNAENRQFGEQIFVASSLGETWTVVSATGFYDASSPAPPASPVAIAVGSPFTDLGGGNYMLAGIRLPNTMWSMVVTNGTSILSLTAAHTCQNPPEAILGDFGVCMGSIESYLLSMLSATNITWDLTGGTIISGQNTASIIVHWDAALVGTYELAYKAFGPAFPGQLSGACDISDSVPIDVMSEEPIAIACNNLVNVSLNGNCDLSITADMILEGMQFSNMSYDLIFRDIAADTIVTGPTIGMEYINTTLEVTVIHDCGGNSCWGYVLLEDKSIPLLDCPDDVTIDCDELMTPEVTGFPVPADVIITKVDDDEYIAHGFDLCSDVVLLYSDKVITQNLCLGPFSSIVERTWVATDVSGNTTSCIHLINVNRATLVDIKFPPSWDDALGDNPSLVACSNYPKLPNGHPDPSFTGSPTGTFCLNVEVRYEDKKLAKCSDETFKILRKWKVTDLCTYEKKEFTQYITVADHQAPVCTGPADYTLGTGDHDCSTIIDVLPPVVSDCSDWTYTISYKPVVAGEDPYFQPTNEGIVDNMDGTFTITSLPAHNGSVWILYYITDECGNLERCKTKITIIDDVEPTPVCDLHTFVSIGDNNYAYAGIDAFDDGSHDNCHLETIEVRRMGTSTWGDRVRFDCNDIGEIIMVELRVTDRSGNTSICMVEAEVQDNKDPEITFCPKDITLDCDADLDNLGQYGTATAIDNCNVTVTPTFTKNINDCGEGSIVRKFTATDDFGNTDVCYQTITVEEEDSFYINPTNASDPNDDVIWPGDVLITNGCDDDAILPENLPSGKQEPGILYHGCSWITFSYDDVVFQYVDEACIKVLRTWTVIDECKFISPYGTQGIWTYTQAIKIDNSTPPTFVEGCRESDLTITQLPNCRVKIEAAALAHDICTDDDKLIYSYKIDNGTFSAGRFVNKTVDFGNHVLTWQVEDECGNVETCTVNFEVDDDKAPTPYCLSEIRTVIMSENGQVEIWASDFDRGSYDNCSDTTDLIASFSTDITDTRMLIECAQMNDTVQEFELKIYITDASGNSDFCTATLVVQDNQDVCENAVNDDDDDDDETQTRVTLAGHIYNDENEMLTNVEMTLESNLPEFPVKTYTSEEGEYAFDNLLGANDYEVKPKSDDNYRDGVNTLDLVKIQRHILGLEIFASPYKFIAADINNDERVSPADLLHLRKLILGVTSKFTKNDSWRFVDANYSFPDPQDPFPFEEDVLMDDMNADYMNADFIAIKIGDLDGTAEGYNQDGPTISSRTVNTIATDEQLLAIGYNEIVFNATDIDDIYGMQLVLSINESLVSEISVSSPLFDITDANVRYNEGKLYLSVNEALPVNILDELFTLKVITKDEAYVSDIISLDTERLSPQLITDDGDSPKATGFDIMINGRSMDIEHDFELFQNVPNPFSTTTDIAFVLPSDQNVTLRVMDITGKMVYSKQGYYPKGYNVITLDISDISASGILHYQIETDTNSDNKKMIIIK